MPAQTLRPYQQIGVSRLFAAYRDGARRLLMVLPTGGGKTSCFAFVGSGLALHKKRTLVLVHRRELALQAANRFREFGVDLGFIMAGEPPRPYAPIQIASVQTLIKRLLQGLPAPKADFVVCDEAHLSTAATWETILAYYANVRILGCTATPWRLGGKPLVGSYDASVVVSTPRELREQGYLSPYKGFSYLAPDLDDVDRVGDEYNQQQSAAAMRAPGIVADIVQQWQAHASDLSTVLFAVTVEHSQQLTAEFRAAGVRAEHLDGTMSHDQRESILARVSNGTTQVLCNVGVTVEGLDIPRLKCCILARPTMSTARAIQMMGRVRRPWNGVCARIHDHAFVIRQHGLPDADRDYTLHARTARTAEASDLTQCKECFIYFDGLKCPECATPRPAAQRGEIITVTDAEQFAFSSDDAAPAAPSMLPPVDIRWEKPGRIVEGKYTGSTFEKTSWGNQMLYIVEGEKRTYRLPGTAHLNELFTKVRRDDLVRVTFLREQEFKGGRSKKYFKLEVDDGSP